MGTFEDARPPITLDNEISSGTYRDHDHDHRDDKGDDSGIDAGYLAANLRHDAGGDDQSRGSSSEEALIEKLENAQLVGEEDVKVVDETGESKVGSVKLEGVKAKVEEKVKELGKGEEDEENGKVAWERQDKKAEKKDVEEEGMEGNGKENVQEGAHRFPLRPDAADCSFYMKTGSCKFGRNCKFNHPLNRENQVDGGEGKENEVQALSDDAGKIECKFYLTPRGCKYGDACRYSHSKVKTDVEPPELNFLGLPIRPEEKECPFYMRNGSCGYGTNCRFHHPDPTATNIDSKHTMLDDLSSKDGKVAAANDSSGFAPISAPRQSMSNSSSSENLPTYVPWVNPLSQGVPQVPGWNQYQVTVSMPENAVNARPAHVVINSFKKADSFGNQLEIPTSEVFPERPGVPECDYFMKTGNCKFRSQCRYHHPKSRLLQNISNGSHHNVVKDAAALVLQHKQPPTAQTEKYPERPGEPECSFFMKTGECKYKSLCRYHHPRSWNPKSYVPAMYGANSHPSGMAPTLPPEVSSASNSYQNNPNLKSKTFKHYQQPVRAEEFPERPGQPECDYFMRTGNCKYGSNCRYHHPKDGSNGGLASTGSNCALNENGLPLRPGAKICRNFEQLGICKYGPRCLFDHPVNYGLSAGPKPPVSESPLNEDAGSEWGDGWV